MTIPFTFGLGIGARKSRFNRLYSPTFAGAITAAAAAVNFAGGLFTTEVCAPLLICVQSLCGLHDGFKPQFLFPIALYA
jgi:hypothetical protein